MILGVVEVFEAVPDPPATRGLFRAAREQQFLDLATKPGYLRLHLTEIEFEAFEAGHQFLIVPDRKQEQILGIRCWILEEVLEPREFDEFVRVLDGRFSEVTQLHQIL